MDEAAVKLLVEALVGGILAGQKKLVIDSLPYFFGGIEGVRYTVKIVDTDE